VWRDSVLLPFQACYYLRWDNSTRVISGYLQYALFLISLPFEGLLTQGIAALEQIQVAKHIGTIVCVTKFVDVSEESTS